ncbi:MAG: hypothetical protein COA61_005330 [Zetaproteobacteria bacterium]|nr:hypothetical protein [Zetaproteobacteria bacterium]
MSFKQQHPNYQNYENENYHVNDFPDSLFLALEGYITRYCSGANQLKYVINDIASRIPCETTQNWGWDFLVTDLSNCLWRFRKSKFHKVMDFLSDFYCQFQENIKTGEFNEFLDDLEIGYTLKNELREECTWELRENVECRIESICESENEIKDICSQTLDHLSQAKEHLINTENNRDRKDAIRDCMSAMEAMLKTITKKKDINTATAFMRQTNKWGAVIIVKDGVSIWNRLHDMYPDIRHGNPTKSELTDEEALYWVDRIICFIKYIAKVHLK